MAESTDVQSILEGLKARKAAIENAIAALEAVAGELDVSIAGGSATRGIAPDTFIGMNILQGAEKYLQVVGRPARTTDNIAEALNKGGLTVTAASVSTILRRSDKGDSPVVRVGRALWGLAGWYPNRPRPQS